MPKEIRVALGLEAGDELEVNVTGEVVTLQRRRKEIPLERKKGFWVHTGGEPASAEEFQAALEAARGERSVAARAGF